MAHCKDCLHFEVCEAFGKTVKFPVDDGVCLHFAKGTNVLTNADRIRVMSDEELAVLLAHETYRMAKPVFDVLGYGITEEFIFAQRLKWLKQPAE